MKLAVLGAILALAAPGMAQVPSNWSSIDNFNLRFKAMTSHGGMFYGVGTNGLLGVSPDGVAWSSRKSGTVAGLAGILHGGGRFLAFGDSGIVLTSSDGVAWARGTGTPKTTLTHGAYGNGVYVLLGYNNSMVTSADGISWTTRNTGIARTVEDVVFGNGRFIAGGEDGLLYHSPDGINWTDRSNGLTHDFYRFARGDSLFLALTDQKSLLSSKDGLVWTQEVSTTRASSLTYMDGRFLTAGLTGWVSSSKDGKTWTLATADKADDLYVVAALGDRMFASGYNFYTSPDGEVWTPRKFGTDHTLNGMAYGNGRYAAVGDWSAALLSGDGVIWTTSAPGASGFFNDVLFDQGLFVAVGRSGVTATSPDGDVWTTRSTATSNAFTDLAYGAAGFIALASNSPFADATSAFGSKDGKTWTALAQNLPVVLEELAFGNGRYVAIGYSDNIRVSSDGTAWSAATLPGTKRVLRSIAYGGGLFATVGAKGAILTSPDGLAWTDRSTDTAADLHSIVHNGSQFVAIGRTNAFRVSTDGISWSKGGSPIGAGRAIFFGGGRHSMIADSDIYTSFDAVLVLGIKGRSAGRPAPGLMAEILPGGMLRLSLPAGFYPGSTHLRVRDMGGNLRMDRPVGEAGGGNSGATTLIPMSGLPPGLFALELQDGRSRKATVIRMLP